MSNPFVHIELNTDDVNKAKKFYKNVFAWKVTDMKGTPPYTFIDVGKGTGGGILKKPNAAMPTAWLPYVAVDDVKKTMKKAKKAGAQIKLDYMPIGDMGAIGVFQDPTGAMLGLWETAKKVKKASKKKSAAKAKGNPKKR